MLGHLHSEDMGLVTISRAKARSLNSQATAKRRCADNSRFAACTAGLVYFKRALYSTLLERVQFASKR